MCGIAGIIDLEGNRLDAEAANLSHMLGVMRHRGPDDRGEEKLGPLLLGHLRLSILDLSPKGHQPMRLGDLGSQVWISYNGEIYNYLELREELKGLGATFFSQSDTEVILWAYRIWGLDCFNRFNGMWALAIWDEAQKRLVLSRDRLGIKPLYWQLEQNRLAFASEIKALAARNLLLGRSLEINPASVQTYLQTGLVDGLEDCFIKGIRRFKQGHLMVVDYGKVSRYSPYWDLPETALDQRDNLQGQKAEHIAGTLGEIIGDAVAIHTRSDVEVGICLSGGLDSSAVACYASKLIPDLNSYTAWFEEGDEWNELPHAEQVVDAYDLQSHPVQVKGSRLTSLMDDLVWYLDEPCLAMGVYPQWHVMEAAANDVTVLMDGQGGDEIFAGYDFYAPRYLYSKQLAGEKGAYQKVLEGYRNNYGIERFEELTRQVAELRDARVEQGGPKRFPGALDDFLFQELTVSRLPALLRYEDRLSMAFSLESRVPLLDYRLVEFAFALGEDFKIGPGWSKHIFRKALDRTLPADITWRKDKKGFPTPFELWAENGLKDHIRSKLLRAGSHINNIIGTKALQDFFRAWDQGQKNPWVLWRLLSLETWMETYQQRLVQEIKKLESGEPAAIASGQAGNKEVKGIKNPDLESLLDEARRASQSKDFKRAAELLEKALDLDPDSPQANNGLGVSLVMAGQPGQAISYFNMALQLSPGDFNYLANLAKAHLMLKNRDEARACLGKALKAAPQDRQKELRDLLESIGQDRPTGRAAASPESMPSAADAREPELEHWLPEAWVSNQTQDLLCRDSSVRDDAGVVAEKGVVHAPSEICGHIERTTRWLRNNGVKATGVNYCINPNFQDTCDINLPLHQIPDAQRGKALRDLFTRVVRDHDIFHFHYARSFYPDLSDLDELKQRGKKILFSFWGSDHRSDEMVYYYQAKFLGYDPPLPYFLNRQYWMIQQRINLYADVLFGSACIPRGLWVMGCADLSQWPLEEKADLLKQSPHKDPNKLYVLHAPSDPRYKGSLMIRRLLDECKAEGMPLELVYVHGLKPQEVRKHYAMADIAVDQVGGATFGLFGIEMLMWETPVLVYQTEVMRRLRNDPPVLPITKANFKEQIFRCLEIKKTGDLAELGKKGRQWAAANVDINTTGLPVYLRIYRLLAEGRAIPQFVNREWFRQLAMINAGTKSGFYRYMVQNNVFEEIGMPAPNYDRCLYE